MTLADTRLQGELRSPRRRSLIHQAHGRITYVRTLQVGSMIDSTAVIGRGHKRILDTDRREMGRNQADGLGY